MFKLSQILSTSSRIKSWESVKNKISSRYIHESYFVSDDEIMENVLGRFITIGINLGDTKNVLTETALDKLNYSVNNFERNNELHAAVLHGCGGNFCTGMVGTDGARELSQSLIKTLQTLNKPIIAALDGNTTDFGLHLAIMCDIRVMDKLALVGLRDHSQKLEMPSFMCERLVLTIGLAKTVELMCTRQSWPATECLRMGLVNKISDSGCALGQSILLAQSIAFSGSLENIIENKSKALSLLSRKVQ